MAESWFLCLSTFQCDHKGATESEAGPSRRDHRCPSLANTGVVASTSGNDCRNSHPPSKQNFPPLSSPSSGDKTHIATKDAFDAMQGIREKFITLGYSSDASHLLMSSWREPTQKAYKTYVAKWNQYASQHQIAVSGPKLPHVINFLTDLFKNGASYSAINTTRSALSAILPSALSAILPHTPSGPVGSHPDVCRLLKGVFEQRPALPKIRGHMGPRPSVELLEHRAFYSRPICQRVDPPNGHTIITATWTKEACSSFP